MLTIITLLMTVILSPTLLDRSNLGNNCDSVLSKRTISKESVNNGFVQGTVDVESIGAVGLVDNKTASYPSCNEFGERFFSAGWIVSASVSASEGLSVIENGAVIYRQNRAYTARTAVIKIQQHGANLRYYLNGRLVFNHRPDSLMSRDLRAYYFQDVESPLIGVQRSIAKTLMRKLPAYSWK